MTSQINPNNIDGTYPVAGQPNNTQGMRDNFTNTKTNFQYAADEITELQSKSVLKSALTGSTLDNNMNDNLLYAVKMQDVSWTYVQNTATAGSIPIDYSAGQYQYISTTGSVSLSFTNWPSSGSVGALTLTINITNIAHTLTLPSAVSIGLYGLEGISPGTPGVSNTITFGQTGQFTFLFTTSDAGTAIAIEDLSRPRNRFNAPLILDAPNVATLTSGALNIIGSNNGSYRPVVGAGGMLHITGNPDTSARITVDGWTTSASAPQPATDIGAGLITLRAARGTPNSPLVVKSGDHLGSIAALGFTSGNAYSQGRSGIEFFAAEDFTANTACGTYANIQATPIGSNVAVTSAQFTGNGMSTSNIVVSGTVGLTLTSSGTMGYNTGAGGTVSQSGNKSTGVTLNKPSGEITMQNTNLAADTTVSFTLTNSTISARDLLLLNIVGGAATGAAYNLDANCTSGSAVISVRNITGGTLGEALVLRYAVIKGSIT